MPALPSRRLVGGQLDVQSKTLASSFSRPEWKRPTVASPVTRIGHYFRCPRQSLFSFQSDQIATRDFHEGGLWQERGSGQADAETPATGLAATADKQIAEMNRGKLRVFRGKLGVSAGLRGGRGLRRCVWRSLLRIGEDHLGPLSEPESLGRVKSGVCVPSSLERPPGSPAGPELPNPFVSGCALEVATFCARRLVPDRRPAQVRH